MIGIDPNSLSASLLSAYHKNLSQVDTWKIIEPNVELMHINYKDVINNPKSASEKIKLLLI